MGRTWNAAKLTGPTLGQSDIMEQATVMSSYPRFGLKPTLELRPANVS